MAVYGAGNTNNSAGQAGDPTSSGSYQAPFEVPEIPEINYGEVAGAASLFVLGQTGQVMEGGQDINYVGEGGFDIDHENPENNIIGRTIDLALYDEQNVRELGSYDIYELLPNPVQLPSGPPVSLDMFVVNWSRLYKWGGIVDINKDPNPNLITDWAVSRTDVNTGNQALFPDFYDSIHRWPEETALDPTYMFYSGDPAIFYTQKVISHYEPDIYGEPKAVMVPDKDIVWKLDGKEVHRGWFLNLDLVDRTVDIIQPVNSGELERVILVPRRITVEAHNSAGVTTKEVKYGAIDNQDGDLIGGQSDPNNFSSTYQGRYHAYETETNERIVQFEKDPRYGARQCFIRFKFDGYGDKYVPKSKFRGAEFHMTLEHNPNDKHEGAFQYDWGEKVYDPWNNGFFGIGGDADKLKHQDAMNDFPDMFGEDGTIHERLKNGGGSMLSEFNVTDFTDGNPSALLVDEKEIGYQSKLYSFWRKPGPFLIACHIQFKRKKKQTVYKGIYSFGRSDADANTIEFETPVQPIDLGVRTVKYTREDD